MRASTGRSSRSRRLTAGWQVLPAIRSLAPRPTWYPMISPMHCTRSSRRQTQEIARCLTRLSKSSKRIPGQGAALPIHSAYAAANRALTANPNDAAAWRTLGCAPYNFGRQKEAIECYSRAIELAPEHAATWTERGGALLAMNQTKAARQYRQGWCLIHRMAVPGLCTRALWTLRRFAEAVEERSRTRASIWECHRRTHGYPIAPLAVTGTGAKTTSGGFQRGLRTAGPLYPRCIIEPYPTPKRSSSFSRDSGPGHFRSHPPCGAAKIIGTTRSASPICPRISAITWWRTRLRAASSFTTRCASKPRPFRSDQTTAA